MTLRPRLLRARLDTLLAAAGEIHHAIAGYALPDGEPDPVASVLAELRIAPLRVPPAGTPPRWRCWHTLGTCMPKVAGSS